MHSFYRSNPSWPTVSEDHLRTYFKSCKFSFSFNFIAVDFVVSLHEVAEHSFCVSVILNVTFFKSLPRAKAIPSIRATKKILLDISKRNEQSETLSTNSLIRKFNVMDKQIFLKSQCDWLIPLNASPAIQREVCFKGMCSFFRKSTSTSPMYLYFLGKDDSDDATQMVKLKMVLICRNSNCG